MFEMKITGSEIEDEDILFCRFILFRTKEEAENFINEKFVIEERFHSKRSNKIIYNIKDDNKLFTNIVDIEIELFEEKIDIPEGQNYIYVFFDEYDEVLKNYRTYSSKIDKNFINEINELVGGFDKVNIDNIIKKINESIDINEGKGFRLSIGGYFFGDEDYGYEDFMIAPIKLNTIFDIDRIIEANGFIKLPSYEDDDEDDYYDEEED